MLMRYRIKLPVDVQGADDLANLLRVRARAALDPTQAAALATAADLLAALPLPRAIAEMRALALAPQRAADFRGQMEGCVEAAERIPPRGM